MLVSTVVFYENWHRQGHIILWAYVKLYLYCKCMWHFESTAWQSASFAVWLDVSLLGGKTSVLGFFIHQRFKYWMCVVSGRMEKMASLDGGRDQLFLKGHSDQILLLPLFGSCFQNILTRKCCVHFITYGHCFIWQLLKSLPVHLPNWCNFDIQWNNVFVRFMCGCVGVHAEEAYFRNFL